MCTHLPHLPNADRNKEHVSTIEKVMVRDETVTGKVIKMYLNKRKNDFDLRLNSQVSEYNPMKDKYLQQFFKRQNRQKIIKLMPKELSFANLHQSSRVVPTIINQKSSFHNIIIEKSPYLNHLQYHKSPSTTQKEKYEPELKQQNTNLTTSKKNRRLTSIKTQNRQKNSFNSKYQLSKEEFKSFLRQAKSKLLAKSSILKNPESQD